MESERFSAKLFALEGEEIPNEDIVLFFHRVIQESLIDETCIDVTDYSHVPGGPGVMLICHEAHYSMERAGGRLGLKCSTKRGATGDTSARIQRVFRKVLALAATMESHEIFGGRLRFDTSGAQFSIEDRLIAPSTQETFNAVAPRLAEVTSRVWSAQPLIQQVGSPKEPFQVEIAVAEARSLQELLAGVV